MKDSTFGVWLKRKTHELGLSGRELAKRVGVSDSAVSRWMSGDQVPGERMLIKIADVFDVDPLALMKRAGKLDGVDVEPAPMPPPQVEREEFEKFLESHIKGASRKSIRRMMDAYDEIIQIEENR